MEESIRFADQSKALWLQHNTNACQSAALHNHSSNTAGSSDPLAYKSAVSSKPPHSTLSCVGRCPFASIIACVITLVGTGVFCGCLYRALAITIQMVAHFKIEQQSEAVKIAQTIVIIVSTVMCSLAIILLIVGCLATGATRSQIYTGFRSRLGGRISTGFFIAVVYALWAVWSVVTLCLVVPIVAYYVLMKNCQIKSEQINTHSEQRVDECLSLKTFGITLSEYKNVLCTNELIAFCNQGKEAGPLYVASFIASALIVLGLLHYLSCLVANYAHIKDGMKLRDYEDAIKEELELRCEMAARARKNEYLQ